MFDTLSLIILIILAGSMWSFFEKLGYNGWKSYIPIYNDYLLCQKAGVKSYFFLLLYGWAITILLLLFSFIYLAFIVSIIVRYCVCYNIVKRFGKDPIYWGIGLLVLPLIIIPILGLGSSLFDESIEVSSYGVFKEKTIEDLFKKNKRK